MPSEVCSQSGYFSHFPVPPLSHSSFPRHWVRRRPLLPLVPERVSGPALWWDILRCGVAPGTVPCRGVIQGTVPRRGVVQRAVPRLGVVQGAIPPLGFGGGGLVKTVSIVGDWVDS